MRRARVGAERRELAAAGGVRRRHHGRRGGRVAVGARRTRPACRAAARSWPGSSCSPPWCSSSPAAPGSTRTSAGRSPATCCFSAGVAVLGVWMARGDFGPDEAFGRAARAFGILCAALVLSGLIGTPVQWPAAAVATVVVAGGLHVALLRYRALTDVVSEDDRLPVWPWLLAVTTAIVAVLVVTGLAAALLGGDALHTVLADALAVIAYVVAVLAWVVAMVVRGVAWLAGLAHLHLPRLRAAQGLGRRRWLAAASRRGACRHVGPDAGPRRWPAWRRWRRRVGRRGGVRAAPAEPRVLARRGRRGGARGGPQRELGDRRGPRRPPAPPACSRARPAPSADAGRGGPRRLRAARAPSGAGRQPESRGDDGALRTWSRA